MNDDEIKDLTGKCWACHYDMLDENRSNCECETKKKAPKIDLSSMTLEEYLDKLDREYGSGAK